MSDSLWPHEMQHSRLPCSSLSPRVCSNSCLLSQWCHPTISSLSSPSPAFNLSQHQGLFQWVGSLHQVAKLLEFQLQHQSFQWIFRVVFLLDWLVWSPYSPRDSQESSPAPQIESINGNSDRLYFLGLQNHCGRCLGHEIKRCLLLGSNAMTNLDSILKSRDITLPTKVCLVNAMVFPVVMYGCESWTIKKAEHRRIDAF